MRSNNDDPPASEVASQDSCQAASEKDVEFLGDQTNVASKADIPPDGGTFMHHSNHTELQFKKSVSNENVGGLQVTAGCARHVSS